MNSRNTAEGNRPMLVDLAIGLGLIVTALVIALFDLQHSGEQWLEDGPRYCNNAAMMRDWMVAGSWSDPIGFAKQNYAQYPAHSVPFHPPGYAFLLGAWFLAIGMSYASARIFVALCLGVSACCFYGILRQQRLTPWMAGAASLLFASSPEVSRWSRTVMSEIPGMLFILAGTFCFVRAVNTNRGRWFWLAFVMAEFAFFCRVTTAGVLPAWMLYLLITKGFRRTVSIHVVLPALIFLLISGSWVKFASAYASYEVGQVFGNGLMAYAAAGNLTIWFYELPGMVGGVALLAAVLGGLLAIRNPRSRCSASLWIAWILCCYGFQVAQLMHFESRYFIFAVPAVCALVGGLLLQLNRSPRWRLVAGIVIASAVVRNAVAVYHAPRGLQGFEAVAAQLAIQDDPGNVLVSCWSDSDLVFRYRCHTQQHSRQLIRGDRVLAVRLPYYAQVAPKVLAENAEDVLDTIRRGRIRYVVTSPPSYPSGSKHDRRHADMVLLHTAALTENTQFSLIQRFPVTLDFGSHRVEEAFLWRYEGELPAGPSELPVWIPTAKLNAKQVGADEKVGQERAG
ncbi:ArnT family glycosyltransferase [Rhodopirellula sp. JC639]|uniref:ArnT family glycosyltransferase n=1 Tax=Stieleria mannarensis TaxID=2755585 RepID=UPI0016032B1A|nr:glycosyltransferase family 39 protein [Rhodopirellula sp. JC639]